MTIRAQFFSVGTIADTRLGRATFLVIRRAAFEGKAASYPSDRIQSTSPRRRIPSRISASLIREYPSKKPVREGFARKYCDIP
jgi:hypothetical protein